MGRDQIRNLRVVAAGATASRERSGGVEAATVQWVEAEVASEERKESVQSLKIELVCGARMESGGPTWGGVGGGGAAAAWGRRAMLSFTGGKVLVCLEACDPAAAGQGFNGLSALVTERLEDELEGGALFVFSNRRHTRLKVLYWDGTGLWVMTKRLEVGTFSWPKSSEGGKVKLRLAPEAFAMLTDGVDLRGGKLRPWYEREEEDSK